MSGLGLHWTVEPEFTDLAADLTRMRRQLAADWATPQK
jgi:hypothetical protein